MHQIPMYEASQDFFECWKAAGSHLNGLLPWKPAGRAGWLRAHPHPPWLEHLSFRLGNQLFFIRIEDEAGEVVGPGSYEGLIAVANGCQGHACIMPMRRSSSGWVPVIPGWGLQDYPRRQALDPPSLVTNRPIEMTEWELQDLAVQIVRSHIESQGHELMSWVGQPGIDPAIWFVGDRGPEFVVVRFARVPTERARLPDNLEDIERRCAPTSGIGHFASVLLARAGESAANAILRGEQLDIFFRGLEPLPARKAT